jgi:DNA-binding response OmpR family regulator
MPGSKILVVEDDPSLRSLAVMILREQQYVVRNCASIHEAGAASDHELPDCITLDMQLRDGSGADLLAWLSESERTAAIPVVIITGTTSPDFIAVALAAGEQDFITKPFEPVELVARVAPRQGSSGCTTNSRAWPPMTH